MHTRQSVSDLIHSRYESDEPDTWLDVLRTLDGKPITKRICDKMPGGKERWILRRAYGMTHLETIDYLRSGGSNGYSVLLAHSESAVPLDVNNVEHNLSCCYFDARRARNHKRMEAMNDARKLDAMAGILNRIESAQRELNKAEAEFEDLADFDGVFEPDKYVLRDATKHESKVRRSA